MGQKLDNDMKKRSNGRGKALRRVIIFWDQANTFHPIEDLGRRIDYEKARTKLLEGYDPSWQGSAMYIGLPSALFRKKKRFLTALETMRWAIFDRPLIEEPSGRFIGSKKQTGVDELMYRDIKELAEEDAYEKAIIVSGDHVFTALVDYLHQVGKKVDVWSFKHCLSRSLAKAAGDDHVFYLDAILDEISYEPKSSQ